MIKIALFDIDSEISNLIIKNGHYKIEKFKNILEIP